MFQDFDHSLPVRRTTDALFEYLTAVEVVWPDDGSFRDVHDANVLIYFPHGFGDWVQLAYILPLLDQSNRYWITCFGDDFVSLMDQCRDCSPLYFGVKSVHCGYGEAYDNRDFGIEPAGNKRSQAQLWLPASLADACSRLGITHLLFEPFYESWGGNAFPFHSKARAALQHLVRQDLLQTCDLTTPLRTAVNFDVAPWVTQWVEARLQNFAGMGRRRLCLIGRHGYTSTGKNWGHNWRVEEDGRALPEGEECRQFMRLMVRKDPTWFFITMEERSFSGYDTVRSTDYNCVNFSDVFGGAEEPGIPFGHIMRALANRAELCVGVPAGVHHLCMAKDSLPCVGLWIEHLPSWYDEPKSASIHVISRNARDTGLLDRPGSIFDLPDFLFATMMLDTRRIYGEQVLAAVETLIG